MSHHFVHYPLVTYLDYFQIMKKTIIIGFALALLLSGTTASARENEGQKGNKGNSENKHKTVVVDASTTAQIQQVKLQIAELSSQLSELKRTSHVGGKTVESDEDNDGNHDNNANTLKACKKFIKEHHHWKWGRPGHRFGWGRWVLDQNIPQNCVKVPGIGTSTLPVIDTTAPVISAISVTSIGTTTTTVNWTTNEGASSKIFVSTTSPVATNGTPAWTDTATTTSHGVQLVGLIPGTTYYYVIRATDAANNTSSSAQGSFVTIPLGDAVAPVISSIAVGSITSTGASISWTTNELSSSKVYLSTTSPVSTSSASWTDGNLLASHTAPLTALATNTTYYFVLQATDASTNTTYSAQGTFTTSVAPDVTAPVITLYSAVPTGSTTASVSWSTNEAASSRVYYSTTSPTNLATAPSVFDATLLTVRGVNLSGLTASTTYYVVAESRDAANNVSTTSQSSFTTNP